MRSSTVFCIAALTLVLYLIWYRKPAGRSSSDPGEPRIKGMKTFDLANPHAPSGLRRTFYDAVQAQLDGEYSRAREGYETILDSVPGEPIATHNLSQLPTILAEDE